MQNIIFDVISQYFAGDAEVLGNMIRSLSGHMNPVLIELLTKEKIGTVMLSTHKQQYYRAHMFTGIVETTAEVLGNNKGRLRVARPKEFDDLKIGASIAVSGVCLTVVGMRKDSMDFDVIEETMERSTMGDVKPGDVVNLERAMKTGDRLDGHVVQGHVEGVAVVTETGKHLTITLPDALLPFVVSKGSIAIDGVSLTVRNIDQNLCSISLIPHTAKRTTLGSLRLGDRVNIETDILQRAAVRS